MRSRRAIVAAALLLSLLSCGDSTAPPQATTIELTLTELTFDALGIATPVFAVVKDEKGNVMSTVSPTWATSAAGVATVNAAGTVTAAGNGAATITATSGSAEATVQVTVDQVPSTFALAATNNGDGLSSARGQPVAVRPAVRLLDGNGRGLAGESVTFTVLSGGGIVPVAAATTDANGVARVASWTLGPDVGPNTLEASYAGFTSVVFTVNGIEDPCTPVGAEVLTLGVDDAGSFATTDCVWGLRYYDLYRLDLAAPGVVVIELSSPAHPPDPYLILLDAESDSIAANDDIVMGEIRNSRIAIELEAGTYFVRATTYYDGETGPYTISARTAAVGVAASMIVSGGNGQVSTPGALAPVPPSVKVLDELGDPVPNVAVTFATVPGVGSATGLDAMTDAMGVATVGSWTLAAGANVLTATLAGAGIVGNPTIFSAMGTANPDGYNISLRFLNVPTQSHLQAFSDAVVRWESIIVGDLPSFDVTPEHPTCGTPAVNETIDDLVIFVRLEPIDGPGNILGSAQPCLIRIPSFLAIHGIMYFDTADLGVGSLPSVILHEMAHVLGFGTIWDADYKNLLVNPSLPSSPGVDTHFAGANAIAAFNAAGGNAYVGAKVPVENTQGGQGTRDGHWRESELKTELMTGFLSGATQPLSAITIRSMQDLGYTVSVATADAYTFVPSLRTGPEETGPTIHLVRDILNGPIYGAVPSNQLPKKPPRPK